MKHFKTFMLVATMAVVVACKKDDPKPCKCDCGLTQKQIDSLFKTKLIMEGRK